MKTKEQILKWLNEQPWKNEFYEEAFFDRGFSIIYDEYFICGAFDWSATKSGAGIWKQRDMIPMISRCHGRNTANKIQLRMESAVLIGILSV